MALAAAERRPKLGARDGPAEHSARRIAALVVESPGAHLGTCSACSEDAPCAACAAGRNGLAGPALRRTAEPGDLPNRDMGGMPLPAADRSYFERRLKADFSAVRVHTDISAEKAARALDARAFALGPHIGFANGAFQPQSPDGKRLLAHELVHTLQEDGASVIRRDAVGGQGDAPAVTPGPTQAPVGPLPIRKWPTTGETVTFLGIELTENPDQLTDVVRHVMAYGYKEAAVPIAPGINAASAFLERVSFAGNVTAGRPCDPSNADDYEYCHRNEVLRTKIVPVLMGVVDREVHAADNTISTFKAQAFENALTTLQVNDEQAKAEGIRYGLTKKQVQRTDYVAYDVTVVPVTYSETQYGMPSQSPTGRGLQQAAQLLLKRREEINARREEQKGHIQQMSYPGGIISMPDAQYFEIGTQIQKMTEDYSRSRSLLSTEYPLLAAVSAIDSGTGDLETLASKGPGPEMAAIIGARIAETRHNIAEVRDGLNSGDINIWRVKKIVELTKAQLGTDADPLAKAVIDEKIEYEQPGPLAELALAVFNIAALLLAGVTGGLSLVAAAGVNAEVAASHVHDYLLQKAMVGTAFDKAKALSQDEPSLFWLAVEVIGTAVDVGTAAVTTFKTLSPLVKAAIAAREGEEAIEATRAVRIAAEEAKGSDFAERVLAQVEAARGGKGAVVQGFEEESKLLQGISKEAEAEVANEIGHGLPTAAGEIHLSETGNIWICHSPCAVLEERYARYFAQDDALATELEALKGRAAAAAEAEKTAKASKDAGEIAKAEQLADQIKADAAALETRIRDAHPELLAAPEDEAALAVKQAQEEAAIPASRRLASDPVELKKLQPSLDKPPQGVSADDPLWRDYVDYFDERLKGLETGAKGVEAPLSWDEYQSFLGKFRRGTQYQEDVFGTLKTEAQSVDRSILKDFADPYVESNVGVAGSAQGEGTKFADQLVVDRATMRSGHPHIEAFSDKSRAFDALFKQHSIGRIQQQVQEDVLEAVSKYGGDVTLRRLTDPKSGPSVLKELYNQTVRIDKVTIVYDAKLAASPDVQKIIRDAARLPLTLQVEVLFLP